MSYDPSYIGGFVGNAGGGKSVSLAHTCITQMLQGRTVWSNMPVKTSPAILARHTFKGQPITYKETEQLDWNLLYMLDGSISDGTVAIDEIGYFNDSRQSGSTKNRLINACIRQVRHRSLNFFYTALDFGMVDFRLRKETDFIVTCDDVAFKPWGKENHVKHGTVILQRYYDISGRMTGKRQDYFSPDRIPYHVFDFKAMPYWHCYDTKDVISLEEAMSGVELDLQKRKISNRPDTNGLEDKIYEALVELSLNNTEVPSSMLWAFMASKGIEGEPNTLGRYIPKTVKRKFSRNEGQIYDLTQV